VFVEGLLGSFSPFGSLCLVRSEVLWRPKRRGSLSPALLVPEGDLPAEARLTVVEALLHGWVQTGVRLDGGRDRWIIHGERG
ncbi:unnamed protein product, partial [Choristocarpus tenellus]